MSRSAFSRRTALGVFGLALVAAVAVLPGRAGRAGDRGEEPLSVASAPVISLQTLATGLGPMTYIANAGDARLFLVIQSGQILIYSGGVVLPTPFLDVSSIIAFGGERGLLSVAFHPNYAANGFFFVYYTDVSGDITIARYKRSTGDPNVADPSSGVVLLTIDHHTPPNDNTNHNGGQLQFGPDGYLYFGTGDGGGGNDQPCNSQNANSALGKLLRIDVNVGTPPFYAIPTTNPHYSDGNLTDPFQLTWAKGVRNPWRFSFDRMTGDLWIGDVGQDAWEEVDVQSHTSTGGENYGWKIMEGFHCGAGGSSGCSPVPPACFDSGYKLPLLEYDHNGGRCAVMGGYVYRGSQDPALSGLYLYGDLCSGQIWATGQLLTPNVPSITTFGEDIAGELYIGTGGGDFFQILHVAATPTPTPTVTLTPTPVGAPTVTPVPKRGVFLLHGRERPTPPLLEPR
jgi:glucose/arabinose dehydrogenase